MVVVVVVIPLLCTNQAWKAFFPKKKAQMSENEDTSDDLVIAQMLQMQVCSTSYFSILDT